MLHTPLPQDRLAVGSSPTTDRFFTSIAKIVDGAVIALCILAPTLVRTQTWPTHYTVALLLAIIAFFALAGLANLYRPWRGESISRQLIRVLLVWSATLFVLLGAAYLTKTTAQYSRVAMTTWLLATPLALLGWRAIARLLFIRLLAHEEHRRNVVVWGSGDIADQLLRRIQGSPSLGLRLVDYIQSDEQDSATPDQNDPQDYIGEDRISAEEELELRAKRGDYSILYITLNSINKARVADLLDRLSDTTVSVYMVPDYFTSNIMHGQWSSLEGIPLVSAFDTPFWGGTSWLKRIQDLAICTLLLPLIALPMLLIALLVKLTSPGPALFKQQRYGLDGRPIRVLKFRTMTVAEDGENVRQAMRNDPRVTKLGSFLRRTSLDELPQFINVLRGEMSVVGPRPHAVAHNEIYRTKVKGYMLRHKVKPGITGWAQINGWRGETDDIAKMEARVEHDLWYIRNWTFALDLRIILLTVVRGFSGERAY